MNFRPNKALRVRLGFKLHLVFIAKLANCWICHHAAAPQLICHIVFARMESYLCEQWACRLQDSTPATPPTQKETWLAWPKSRSKVSCCWRLSIWLLALCVCRCVSHCLAAGLPLGSTYSFHPSYIIHCSDKWKNGIECQFVMVITGRDAGMRDFQRLLLWRSVFWDAADAPNNDAWSPTLIISRVDIMRQPVKYLMLLLTKTHVRYAHISDSKWLHLHSFTKYWI